VTEEVESHQTNTEMIQSAPAEVDAGTDMALKVKVSCSSNCNLQGGKVRIVDDEGAVVKETELVSFDGAVNDTDEFVVHAPIRLGEYTWSVVFPAQEKQGVLHEESSTPLVFKVKPHSRSMAVWDVPSPIAFNDKFKIKVGVRCSAECNLMGNKIEIYDHEGGKVATATLGDVPWPDTSALYWAEVELEAPGTEGSYSWEVKLPKPDLELPHEEASYKFGFITARAPEHVVTVEVIDKDTKTPIENAYVFVQPYSGYTDDAGVAKIGVTKGEYKIYVLKGEYKDFQTTAEVASDIALQAELLFDPDVGF